MRILVALILAVSCSAQVAVQHLAAPYPWAIKYQGVDGLGQTTFGHQAFDQNRHEVRLANGDVVGQYSYINAEGEPAVTIFVAGRAGYSVVGSNVLPEGPPADYVPEYSEEVALARARFFEAFEGERMANMMAQKVALEPEPTFTAGQPEVEEPAPVAEVAENVPEYSEDVALARARFFEAFEGERMANMMAQKVALESEPTLAPVAEYVPEYSEEVALARARFFEAFEEARMANMMAQKVALEPEPTFTAGQQEGEEPVPVAEAEPEVSADEETPALSIAVETAEEPVPVAEPAAEESIVEAPVDEAESIYTSRRRRSLAGIPLPYIAAVPTETETTIESKQFVSVEAPTPAATKKIELMTKEHVFRVPGFKYMQPSAGVQPAQFSLLTPQVAPFPTIFYPGFGYPFAGVVPASPNEE